MTLVEEYLDVLRTMQICVAMEYVENGKKAKPVKKLRQCTKLILKRAKHEEVKKILTGIYIQSYPPGALNKIVREFEDANRDLDIEVRRDLGLA